MSRLTLLLVLSLFSSVLGAVSGSHAKQPLGFVRGHTWGWVGSRGDYASPEAAESMRKLAETGADTVCIAFGANLPTYDTPHFTWGDANPAMVTDDEIRHAIDLARTNGLKVILKPVVNCDDGVWRAWIRFHRPLTESERTTGVEGIDDPWGEEPRFRAGETVDEEAWSEWWDCFGGFVEHYAQIAAEKNVEALCLGCEMNSTESFVDEWKSLISRVQARYDGPLTYNANHGRENLVPFWDAIDFLSVSAYYPVEPPAGQSVEEAVKTTTSMDEMRSALTAARDELRRVYDRYGKPILFIEVGVTNVRGAARYPWSHPDANLDSPIDQAEQANYYRAMFEVFWEEPWFLGYAWWDWPSRLYPVARAEDNRGFCIYGKEAESVVRQWYSLDRDK